MPKDYQAQLQKTIDPLLLSDNWQLILDVCDKVDQEPEQGSRLVVQAIELKLGQRDANVQLRTLSLLTSIAENCGSRVKQEIASKHFTSVLLNKLKDPLVHKEIKIKIVQVITQLSESFQNDSSLKPIQDAYHQVKSSYSQFFPPDKPQKFTLDNDRLKEEEDLKAAIALSLAENNQASIPTSQEIQQQQQQQDPADLHFRKGDIITVLDRVYKDWGKGSLRGSIGLFPFNYVTPLYDPTPQELIKESEMESKILSQSRQVEKLLTLLTNNNVELIQNDEFQKLYQEIVLIKPELGGLIEKYRVRRDELLDLHGKLKDATVKYEELTDPLKQQQLRAHQQPPPPSNFQYQQPQPSLYQQRMSTGPAQFQQQPQQPPLQQSVTGQPLQQPLQYNYQQQQPQQPPSTTFPNPNVNPLYQRQSFTGSDQLNSPVQPPQQPHSTERPYPNY
ncbi:unnamed protein product [Wickerhamomyces anomalus]